MSHRLGWGILGTGRISTKFAQGVLQSSTGRLVAVGSRRAEQGSDWLARLGVSAHAGDYDSVLQQSEVGAVYLGLPNHLHAPWSIRAAEAGKHVLCEKPLAMNVLEAETIIAAARRCKVFLMEAFMYRMHPQTERIVQVIREGAIGQVQHIDAKFSFDDGLQPDDYRSHPQYGGGGIMDVGCYCLSMSRLIAGAAVGTDIMEPVSICGQAAVDRRGVDLWAVGSALFLPERSAKEGEKRASAPGAKDDLPPGITASLTCGMRMELDTTLTVTGTAGKLIVPCPWLPGPSTARIRVESTGQGTHRVIDTSDPRDLYEIEADYFAQTLAQGQARAPGVSWDDSLGNMECLDRWRRSANVRLE